MSYQSLITFSNPYVKIGSTGQIEVYDVCGKLRIRLTCNGSIQIFNSDGITQNLIAPDNQFLTKNNTLDDGSGNVTIKGSLVSKNNTLDDGSGNVTIKGSLVSKNNTLDDGSGDLTATGYVVAKSGYSNNGTPVGFGWYYANDPSSTDVGIRLDSPAGTPTFKVLMNGNLSSSGILSAVGTNSAQAPQNVTSNRSLNSSFPNNSGKNLFVTVSVQVTVSSSQIGSIQANVGGVLGAIAGVTTSGQAYTGLAVSISFIVPNGSSYKVQTSGSGTFVLNNWTEQTF
jgi:hypothetical protein